MTVTWEPSTPSHLWMRIVALWAHQTIRVFECGSGECRWLFLMFIYFVFWVLHRLNVIFSVNLTKCHCIISYLLKCVTFGFAFSYFWVPVVFKVHLGPPSFVKSFSQEEKQSALWLSSAVFGSHTFYCSVLLSLSINEKSGHKLSSRHLHSRQSWHSCAANLLWLMASVFFTCLCFHGSLFSPWSLHCTLTMIQQKIPWALDLVANCKVL